MEAKPADRDPNGDDTPSAGFVRWIPLVVPMFAVMIAALVYLIGAEVL